MTRSRQRLSTMYLGSGAMLAAIYFALPPGGTAQSVIYDGLGGTAVLAILWAVRLHRPERPLPWILFAQGLAISFLGDTEVQIEADKGRIFQLLDFFRSERATDRHIPGTGLGLFIARAIAQEHGGRIAASSSPGAGTTFRIELPARVASPPGESAAELVA